MRFCVVLLLLVNSAVAFVPNSRRNFGRTFVRQSTTSSSPQQTEETESKSSTQTVGLITFDLDDTLYPLDLVIKEANAAFANAMEKYGFPDIDPNDIDRTSVKIRKEMAEQGDAVEAAVLSHTDIRKLAIRRAMEEVMLERKLIECAEDWATNRESLGPVVVASAKKWSTKAVSSSVIDAVLTAWEMERHHAAERHLYPEVLPALKQIKKDHPGAVIGAVTDGKANPMFMTFTLGKFFDFCMNWEDDQGNRRKFFQELSKVEGNAELGWIYNATREQYYDLSYASAAIDKAAAESQATAYTIDNPDDKLWIHVGDDLGYDVGGSAACGAKTVYVELADKYGQTARKRFDKDAELPQWSVSSDEELKARAIMNEAAKEFVDERLEFWHLLPDLVNKILDEAGNDE